MWQNFLGQGAQIGLKDMGTQTLMSQITPTMGNIGKDALLTGATEVGQDALLGALPMGADLSKQIGADAILNSAGLGANSIAGFGEAAAGAKSLAAGGVKPGMLDSLKSLLGSKAFENTAKVGFQGYGAYEARKGRKDAKAFQDANLKMAQGAYDRNVERDKNTSNLVF